MSNDFDSGLGTTVGMWQMLSDFLDGELFPESLNLAIQALCEGRAEIVRIGGDENELEPEDQP